MSPHPSDVPKVREPAGSVPRDHLPRRFHPRSREKHVACQTRLGSGGGRLRCLGGAILPVGPAGRVSCIPQAAQIYKRSDRTLGTIGLSRPAV